MKKAIVTVTGDETTTISALILSALFRYQARPGYTGSNQQRYHQLGLDDYTLNQELAKTLHDPTSPLAVEIRDNTPVEVPATVQLPVEEVLSPLVKELTQLHAVHAKKAQSKDEKIDTAAELAVTDALELVLKRLAALGAK